jgi:hypothetical protein
MADTWIGVDLGKLSDFTAACVLERSLSIGEKGWPERNSLGFRRCRFVCRAIKRYKLGTPYARIVEHVVAQCKRPDVRAPIKVVIDGSGVGIGVEEMFRSALSGSSIECHAISITAGRTWSIVGSKRYNVAKLEIVGVVREALESGRIKVPSKLEFAKTLARELQSFKRKITDSANETFGARSGSHDDLVLALVLPVWLASQRFMEIQTSTGNLTKRERQAIDAEAAGIDAAEIAVQKAEKAEFDRQREEAQQFWRQAESPHMWTDFAGNELDYDDDD